MLIQGNGVDKLEEIKDGLWNETSRIQDSVDDMIVAATQGSKLSLDGSEMLSYYSDSSGLQNRLKYEVSESIEYALEEGKNKLREYLDSVDIKIPSDCFQSDYPCLFNKETIARIEEGIDFLISKVKTNQSKRGFVDTKSFRKDIQGSLRGYRFRSLDWYRQVVRIPEMHSPSSGN